MLSSDGGPAIVPGYFILTRSDQTSLKRKCYAKYRDKKNEEEGDLPYWENEFLVRCYVVVYVP